ncbi:Rhodanese-related sulfurtransferase [Flavobacteriaceae bacterium MAR_2010_188]|nr:Rhodanese-related sulfurtransferase [Flavobacteriaceae bacterium MAR_2010_188]
MKSSLSYTPTLNLKVLAFIFMSLLSFSSQGQDKLSQLLNVHNEHLVPYISVNELAMPKTGAIILDARETEEYNVSHIPNAVFVGYNSFEIDNLTNLLTDKDQKIVVYCTIGIRSENIANKLKKAGYYNVFNLYGGIFEWKNNDLPVLDLNEQETEKVHTFSREWEKWLKKGKSVN